jgi:catechol 2,3-dioxygenase-like lactoylglutathione lyase family enzyme
LSIFFQKKFENHSNVTVILKAALCGDNARIGENPEGSAMHLDHATIVTPDLDAARRFFVDIVGLTDGARPPFRVDGAWLYADGRAVIHLVDATAPVGVRGEPAPGRAAPRIDHIAFRVDSGDAWRALVARMDAAGVGYQRADVPLTHEVQLFVALAPGVVIEFVTAAQYASS